MNLEIKNGNFSYTDGNPILKDINLKIDSGEIVRNITEEL